MILIIDDSKTIRDFVIDLLESDGLKTISANDGETGIELAKLHRPHVILLDVVLPGINGLLVCKKLKELPETKHIPVIFSTGLGDDENIEKAFELGAIDYIQKPFSKTQLLMRVRNQYAMQKAISEQIQTAKEMHSHKKKFELMFEYSPQAIAISDYNTQKIIDANHLFCEQTNTTKKCLTGKTIYEIGLFTKQHIEELLEEMGEYKRLENKDITITTKDKTISALLFLRIIEIDNEKLLITIFQDISPRRNAMEQLKNSLEEKEFLINEIHHRVKNNMQMVGSLMNKQKKYVDNPETIKILNDNISRVKVLALVQEQLHRTNNFAKINFADYIHDFAQHHNTKPESSNIKIITKVVDCYLPIDKAIPIALIVNELYTNAIKYAFTNTEEGSIHIAIKKNIKHIILIVKDNGIGLPNNFKPEEASTLGMYLVYNIVTKQLDGTLKIDNTKGTKVTITI